MSCMTMILPASTDSASFVVTLFKGSGTQIAQGGVQPLTIVPDFNILEDD
jgi:hypothetical protein